MELTIDNLVLQRSAEIAGRAISSKAISPTLSHILLDARQNELWVTATNLEFVLSVRVDASEREIPHATVLEQGCCLIPAAQVIELAKYAPAGPIQIHANGASRVKLHSVADPKTKAQLPTLDADEFPQVWREVKEGIALPAWLVKVAIASTIPAAAENETRPVLSGVHIKVGHELIMEAADGFRLARVVLPLEHPVQNAEWLVGAKALDQLRRLIEKHDEAIVVFDGTPNTLYASVEDDGVPLYLWAAQQIESKYPDVDQIIPKSFATTLDVSVESFERAIRFVRPFARESANVVRLEVEGDQLIVAAEAADSGDGVRTIPVVKTGSDVTIAFNAEYLLDWTDLAKKRSETLRLCFNSPSSPGVFIPVEDPQVVTLVTMPMYLGNR